MEPLKGNESFYALHDLSFTVILLLMLHSDEKMYLNLLKMSKMMSDIAK